MSKAYSEAGMCKMMYFIPFSTMSIRISRMSETNATAPSGDQVKQDLSQNYSEPPPPYPGDGTGAPYPTEYSAGYPKPNDGAYPPNSGYPHAGYPQQGPQTQQPAAPRAGDTVIVHHFPQGTVTEMTQSGQPTQVVVIKGGNCPECQVSHLLITG